MSPASLALWTGLGAAYTLATVIAVDWRVRKRHRSFRAARQHRFHELARLERLERRIAALEADRDVNEAQQYVDDMLARAAHDRRNRR